MGVKQMEVPLTPELEKFVSEKVTSGLYDSATTVIEEGLRLLKERDELKPSGVEGKESLFSVEAIKQSPHRSSSVRPLGQDRGLFTLPENFIAPLPDELLLAFEDSSQ
jgi:putative addiction module CopG family antidote